MGVQPAPSSGNLLGTIRDLFLDAPSALRYAVGLIVLATFVVPVLFNVVWVAPARRDEEFLKELDAIAHSVRPTDSAAVIGADLDILLGYAWKDQQRCAACGWYANMMSGSATRVDALAPGFVTFINTSHAPCVAALRAAAAVIQTHNVGSLAMGAGNQEVAEPTVTTKILSITTPIGATGWVYLGEVRSKPAALLSNRTISETRTPRAGETVHTIVNLNLHGGGDPRNGLGSITGVIPPGSEVQVTGALSHIDKVDPATHHHMGYSVWAPVKIVAKTPSVAPSAQESVVRSSAMERAASSTGRSAAVEGPSTGLQRGETDGLALARETIEVFTATGPNGTGIYFRNIGTKPILLVSLVPSCAAPTQCPPIYNKLVAPVKVASDGAHDYTYSAATQWLSDFTWEAQLVTPSPSAISR